MCNPSSTLTKSFNYVSCTDRSAESELSIQTKINRLDFLRRVQLINAIIVEVSISSLNGLQLSVSKPSELHVI